MAVDVTADRAARNQSAFREANEQLEARAEAIGVTQSGLPFICECPDPACTSVTLLSVADYEHIRSRGSWFLTVPGHETCVLDGVRIARVVARNDAYSLMEKVGGAAETAEELDPRS